MARSSSTGSNRRVTGKAADSGYDATKSTVPKLQVQLPNLQNLFQSGASGTGRQVTGKAADSNYTGSKTTSSLPHVQSAGGVSNSGYTAPKGTSSTTRVQSSALQTTTQNPGASGTTRQVTGKAADSGYTPEKKQASQQANRQIVQNWLNNEQTKSAQDNSTDRAYTAKLTGGANIDNSAEVMKSLQRTFGGVNDSARTQYNRTLQSKMGYGRNWGNPRSAVGNAIESGVAGVVADWLNAAGTALKSDRRSGLAVDSGDVEAKATGKEWYNRAGNYLQKEADRARMLSENAYLRGSRGLNNAQTLLFDGTVAGTQMAGDIALGTLTGGSATIPMAIRGFGGASQQARQAGATENQQIVYGAANALKEALTEKLFDGLAGAYGKGSADDFVDDLARNLTKSEGGQALLRGLLNTGGEGAEEVISGFVDPALQSIYNGKTLGENYRELNMADLLHGGAVGMLLGGLGGSVDIVQMGYGATGSRQINSYTDAVREMQSEQNAAAFAARYKELERKYLEGTLGKEEEDELWELERMKGQAITPEEANKLWRLESVGEQPKFFAGYEKNEYNAVTQWEDREYLRRVTFVENAPCLTTPKKFTGYFLNPEAKHAEDFINVGYTKEDPMRLRYDIAKQFDMSKAVDFKEMPDGAIRFNIYMELGVTKKRRFLIGWIQDTPDSVPRIVTGFRKEGGRNNGE